MLLTLDQQQTTLGGAFRTSGTGVFTGKQCTVTLEPAPADHGLVFLVDGHRIPVNPERLITYPNRSTLVSAEDPSVGVNMVEHVVSALHGMQIDNALITVEGGECPLGDGSSAVYAVGIQADPVVSLDAPRRVLRPETSMRFEAGDAWLEIGPPTGEALEIDYELHYEHPIIGRDRVRYSLTPQQYAQEIAPARTFIPAEEAGRLVELRVLQSTDDTTCLVVYADRTNYPLRVPHEFAAHKVLDLIGDLRLCGYPVHASVRGYRSGHGLNHQAARWLAAQL